MHMLVPMAILFLPSPHPPGHRSPSLLPLVLPVPSSYPRHLRSRSRWGQSCCCSAGRCPPAARQDLAPSLRPRREPDGAWPAGGDSRRCSRRRCNGGIVVRDPPKLSSRDTLP
ncbi:unnamed protein product [Triticum turgidum subsp. durum]|uniref:Uncharacterized protein n=1 Tax=Triticum turgidum subsp. durum TaxID=4567 RepID=A0A9R0Y746_TRITD|nr:unnamed protein product [Triticum turgidum subsp. durum]